MSNTGPNTPEGKAAVAMNGLRHGLRSESIVLPGVESEEEWTDFRDGILESLAPRGRLEEELAHRVALLQWRLRRAVRAEHDAVIGERTAAESHGDVLHQLISSFSPESEYESIVSAGPELPPASLPGQLMLSKIMRYEAQYTRQLFQTLHALQALQDKRSGKAAPLVRVQWH